jgi:hypothetical protein
MVGINEGIISPKNHWRDRPLRRHEGERHRPRRLEIGIEEFIEVEYLCMGDIDR